PRYAGFHRARKWARKRHWCRFVTFLEALVQTSVEPDLSMGPNRSNRSPTAGNRTLLKAHLYSKKPSTDLTTKPDGLSRAA
ncbi:MAG TPA: hypothetical protein VJ964_09750, partial [Balneolaceae bacterium]|nr:hypothetical protein [Balneolaceae bacterium]